MPGRSGGGVREYREVREDFLGGRSKRFRMSERTFYIKEFSEETRGRIGFKIPYIVI